MDFFSDGNFFAHLVGNNDGQLQASLNLAQKIASELDSNTFLVDMQARVDFFFKER